MDREGEEKYMRKLDMIREMRLLYLIAGKSKAIKIDGRLFAHVSEGLIRKVRRYYGNIYINSLGYTFAVIAFN